MIDRGDPLSSLKEDKCGQDKNDPQRMLQNTEKTFFDMENVHVYTMQSAVFMGKNFQDNQNPIVNTADLILKKMFDISTKLVTEQDEIKGLQTIGWEKHS